MDPFEVITDLWARKLELGWSLATFMDELEVEGRTTPSVIVAFNLFLLVSKLRWTDTRMTLDTWGQETRTVDATMRWRFLRRLSTWLSEGLEGGLPRTFPYPALSDAPASPADPLAFLCHPARQVTGRCGCKPACTTQLSGEGLLARAGIREGGGVLTLEASYALNYRLAASVIQDALLRDLRGCVEALRPPPPGHPSRADHLSLLQAVAGEESRVVGGRDTWSALERCAYRVRDGLACSVRVRALHGAPEPSAVPAQLLEATECVLALARPAGPTGRMAATLLRTVLGNLAPAAGAVDPKYLCLKLTQGGQAKPAQTILGPCPSALRLLELLGFTRGAEAEGNVNYTLSPAALLQGAPLIRHALALLPPCIASHALDFSPLLNLLGMAPCANGAAGLPGVPPEEVVWRMEAPCNVQLFRAAMGELQDMLRQEGEGGARAPPPQAAQPPQPPAPVPATHRAEGEAELVQLTQEILASITAQVPALHLELPHPVLTLPDPTLPGGSVRVVLQPIPGPCIILAIFNYLAFTGQVRMSEGSNIRYGSILRLTLTAVLKRLSIFTASTQMLVALDALTPEQQSIDDRHFRARALEAGRLIASAARLPFDEHFQRRVNADGSPATWAGAEAQPVLDGSMDDASPVTRLCQLLGIPFLHGFVPAPGSVADVAIGSLSAGLASAAVFCDVARDQERIAVQMPRFAEQYLGPMHAGAAAAAAAPALHREAANAQAAAAAAAAAGALEEAQAWLSATLPGLGGGGAGGPAATPTGLHVMRSRFLRAGGYAIQYATDHFNVLRCAPDGALFQHLTLGDLASGFERWCRLDAAGEGGGVELTYCDESFQPLAQRMGGGVGGGGGGGGGGAGAGPSNPSAGTSSGTTLSTGAGASAAPSAIAAIPDTAPAPQWPCRSCTYLNHANNTQCSICSTLKTAPPAEHAAELAELGISPGIISRALARLPGATLDTLLEWCVSEEACESSGGAPQAPSAAAATPAGAASAGGGALAVEEGAPETFPCSPAAEVGVGAGALAGGRAALPPLPPRSSSSSSSSGGGPPSALSLPAHSGSGSGSGGGGSAGGGTPMLWGFIDVLSFNHRDRVNRLITHGASKVALRRIVGLPEAEREEELCAMEAAMGLERLA